MLHSKPVLELLATTYRMPQQTKSELKKRIGNWNLPSIKVQWRSLTLVDERRIMRRKNLADGVEDCWWPDFEGD